MAKIVTITNPLTGQPAQVDQLDHTAQQIDDGLNIARGVSNPNLLDNWYLGNPVDQRQGYVVPPGTTFYGSKELTNALGVTPDGLYQRVAEKNNTYAKYKGTDGVDYYCAASDCVRGYTGAGYGIDRWLCSNVTVGTNGITFVQQSAYIIQKLEDNLKAALNGRTVTASILLTTGELVYGTLQYDSAPSSSKYFKVGTIHIVNNTAGNIMFWANTASTAKAAKLELGAQQTLAHQDANGNWVLNELPNYADTLARCQRYARWMDGCYSGYIDNVNNIQLSVPEIKDMRTLPTISNIQWDRFVAIPYGDGGAFNVSSDYETAITYNGLRIGNTGLNISRYLPVATVFNLRAFLSADL